MIPSLLDWVPNGSLPSHGGIGLRDDCDCQLQEAAALVSEGECTVRWDLNPPRLVLVAADVSAGAVGDRAGAQQGQMILFCSPGAVLNRIPRWSKHPGRVRNRIPLLRRRVTTPPCPGR